MAKDFKSKSPLTNLAAPAAPAEGHKTIDDKATAASTEPEIQKTKPAKKRVGRPVEIMEPRKNINIAIKVELLDKYNEVKKALGCNLTAYIGKLMEKDMDANYENYKTLANLHDEMGL